MGESTDNSSESDESIEVQERADEFGIGKGIDQSRGFSDDVNINTKYMAGQNLMAQNVLNNIKADNAFAQEQMNIDQFGYDPNQTSVNVGAGDIFGLKDSIENQLALGGTPVFNKDGTIGGVMGAMRDAPAFGMLPSFLQNMLPDTQVYTGIADLDPNRFTPDDDNTSNETTPPVMNQMTGKSQCPEGYVFDNQLQACRLKTRTDNQLGTPKDPPDDMQMFARNYSLLNQTPMNVPQGFDYNAMNTNFMNRFGTRPSIFRNPPNLLGFTPFGGQ